MLVVVMIPFFKARHTFVQVTTRFKFGILYLHNGNLGQGVCKEDAEVRGKVCKGIVAALYLVNCLSIMKANADTVVP